MIIIRIWEGLGNQMFQYAFAKSLQHHTDEPVVLDCKHSFQNSLPGAKTSIVQREYKLDYFRIKLAQIDMKQHRYWNFLQRANRLQQFLFILSEKGLYPFRYVRSKSAYAFDETMFHQKRAYIMGYFQNERYFRDIRKELISDFTPKHFRLNTQLKNVLNNPNVISVHVRRTDFKNLGIVLDNTYYNKAVDYMNSRVRDPVYLIFSDDMEWVKKNIDCKARTYYASELGDLSDCDDLMLMSLCTHNIIANSTFSWWGAWLNQNDSKIVVAPKRWITKSRGSYKILPKEWIKI